MKILQLCNKVPYPPNDGGSIAVFNLTVSFSDNDNQVTVLAMITDKHRGSPEDIPEKYRKRIDFHFVPVDTRIKPLNLLMNLFFSSKPYNAVRFVNARFNAYLQTLLTSDNFDVVQLEGLYLTPYIRSIRERSSATISYRAHNVEHEIWARSAETASNPLKKFYFGILANRLERFEKQMINTYDLLIPITDRDAQKLNEMGNIKPVKVSQTGIPEFVFQGTSSADNRNSLFYIGSLDWIPNQQGLKWFVRNVWSEIRLLMPELTFHVAGRNAPSWFGDFCAENKIEYHGEVENAYAFYDRYRIMIVPLFAGSGMRIKIIEAMARSKVIITTSVGAEGLGLVNREHAIIADEASGMKKAITQLLENRDFFAKLEKNSYNFVKTHYSNEKTGKELFRFYEQYLKK
ncbi:MAG: glycosyltransferase family 4 protein [Bacteroidales bacterium]|jgi:glycosyltransferase involved in cell wall biosynthesis